jgi:hypothetical protein
MKAEWKVKGALGQDGAQLLIATIRTEHEVILSRDTLHHLNDAVQRLRDESEMVSRDEARFAWELEQLIRLYNQLSDTVRPVAFRSICAPWQDFTGHLSYDGLKLLAESLSDERTVRLEGSPASGMELVFTFGLDVVRQPVDEGRLHRIKAECEAILKELGEVNITSPVKVIGLILGAIRVGIAAWEAYRNEQDRQRQENERREERERREQLERECQEPIRQTAGGPANDALLDRISGTA